MAKVKAYSNEATADAIAKKLSTDTVKYGVHKSGTQFLVMTSDEWKAHQAEAKSTSKPAAAKTGKAPAAKKAADTTLDENVTVDIPNAKITAQYVITPKLGSRPRWFERKRLVSAEPVMKGDDMVAVRITATRRTFASRGLKDLAA